MNRLSDGRHGVRQTIQPPRVQTQTTIGHVAAKHREVHQMQSAWSQREYQHLQTGVRGPKTFTAELRREDLCLPDVKKLEKTDATEAFDIHS